MLISIVIPVYNVEKYIKECIESVLHQSFGDYEIILVDDGSTDNSGTICDEYANKHFFITAIHKENGGLSDARNVGIKYAKGEYLLFLDSDDYIGNESLGKISEMVLRSDIEIDVMFLRCYKVFSKRIIPSNDGFDGERINGKEKRKVLEHLALLPKYPGSACTKLIRRKLILDNNIYFEKGLLSEDLDWTIKLLISAQQFAYCDIDYYYYRQSRDGSITNAVNIKNLQDQLYIIEKWSSKEHLCENQDIINSFMAYEYGVALYNYGVIDKDQQIIIERDVKRLSWIMKYAKTRKTKLIFWAVKACGIQVTSTILKYVYRSRQIIAMSKFRKHPIL